MMKNANSSALQEPKTNAVQSPVVVENGSHGFGKDRRIAGLIDIFLMSKFLSVLS